MLILLFCSGALAAQTPTTRSYASTFGFSYSLPADWQVVDTASSLPAVRQKVMQDASSEGEKQGAACAQIQLTARHGDPPSAIVTLALPYDCLGRTMTDGDLPGFGGGVSEGLKKTFDVSDPVDGAYTLGRHQIWIERVKATSKAQPDRQYTIEVVCTVLQKAAVCWMAMATDASALQVFESGAVELEGEPPCALVPLTAFAKKPS